MMFLQKFIRCHSRFLYNALHQLFIPTCILCGRFSQHSKNICDDCRKDLPILTKSCHQCAQILHFKTDLNLCGTCLNNPPSFDFAYALFPYQPPIIQLIIALKFRGQLSHAKAMGELLAQKIRTEWYVQKSLPDLIIPVPLHSKRLQERGFNQAVEIARPIAKSLGIALDIFSIERIKQTRAQSGLSAIERKRNMTHAFVAHGDYKNLTIAIIDDVITTGHTITEFCKVLKQKNAKSIHVWCCARSDIALKPKTI